MPWLAQEETGVLGHMSNHRPMVYYIAVYGIS